MDDSMPDKARVQFYSDRQKNILIENLKLQLGQVNIQHSQVMTEKYKLETERSELEDLISKLHR